MRLLCATIKAAKYFCLFCNVLFNHNRFFVNLGYIEENGKIV